MRIEIITKNYRLDDKLQALIEKKLERFDKYFDNEAKALVKLSKIGKDKKDKYSMEISIDSQDMSVIRSVVLGDEMNENIDVVLPKLEKQIVKYRNKMVKVIRKNAFDTPSLFLENEEIFAEKEEKTRFRVVKNKRFNMSVTTIDNAIEEMEMLGHDFYVFLNGNTNRISVVYRRNDGDYGLIEPEK